MAQEKPDWFKMDPAKFLQDGLVDAMSTEELGAAFRLLCRQWIDGFIPDDLNLLARLCRMDRSAMDEAWVILSKFFPELESGKRANRFMWEEREVVSAAMYKRRDDGRIAVQKRWNSIHKDRALVSNRSPIDNPIQESEEETETEVPPTPKRGSKRKRRTPDEIMSCYPDTVRQVVNAVLPIWPGEDPDGRPINPDRELLCVNVDLIFKDHPEAKPELLIDAAKTYLAKPKMRFCAPQYFFGRGKPGGDPPHWVAEYRMAQHQASRKLEMAAAS